MLKDRTRKCGLGVLLLFPAVPAGAVVTVGQWSPIYQGVDYATGSADATEPRLQQVQAVRVDLQNPTVGFFSTPKTSQTLDTIGQTTSSFLTQYHTQVAINASFYGPVSLFPTDIDIVGLSMSNGTVVSAPTSGSGSPVLAITQANVASFITTTTSTDPSPYWNAVAGGSMLLVNGVNLGDPNSTVAHPRSLAGISQDNRYLYLITIDGRQTGYSDGAIDYESALWLTRFGAYNGLNLDGGGSTTLVRDNAAGGAVVLNSPINANTPGFERLNGNALGVFAAPLPEPGAMLLFIGLAPVLLRRVRRQACSR